MPTPRTHAPLLGLAALTALALAAHPAFADANLLQNGDFSMPTAPSQSVPPETAYSNNDITDWGFNMPTNGDTSAYGVAAVNTPTVPDPTYNVTYTQPVPGGGSQVAYINQDGGSIYQTVTLTAGTTYDGSVYVGNRSDFNGNPPPGPNEGSLNLFEVTPAAEYGLEVVTGTTTEAPSGGFSLLSFVYTPTLSGTYNFALTGVSGQANFADASLTPAVTATPEPSTLAPFALAGAGLLGLMLRARRRQGA